MQSFSKSDWKHFQACLIPWRERFITRLNKDIQKILNSDQRTETEKFWDIATFQKKKGKILTDCLDGFTKSRMGTHLLMMLNYGMITEADLSGFSEDLQEELKRVRRRM